jgi:hypothetical protein
MPRRLLLASFFIASTLCLPATVDARQAARPATIAKPAAPTLDLGWLSAPIREEPSPAITSLKGVGTANAVAEARLTPQILTEFCSSHAQHYASRAHCVETVGGNKIFRASADCTAGRITTTAALTYTLDGVWGKDSDGAGRTRWKNDSGSVVAPDLVDNGLHISQQWEKLCPGPVTPALVARAKGAPAAALTPAQAAGAAQRPPSVCPSGRVCDEVPSFAAAITDFRASQYDQATKAVSATVRFVNKTNRPLILGYVRNASVAINEAGNRYTIDQPANVRGIAEIAGGQFDPKFTVQPGQAADARFEFWWRWDGRAIIGQRAWDIDLTVREVNEVAPGQYRFGQEHALQFKAVSPGNMTSTAPAGGALSTVAAGAAPAPAASAAPPSPAPPAAPAQVPANQPDACAGRIRCFDAGPFMAEILTATATREQASRPWHTVSMNIRFTNRTNAPIILGYVVPSGVLIDDLGNRYTPSGAPNDAKGIGKVQARSADPQFVLRPGESRQATLGQARVMRGTPTAGVIGSSYTFDVSIAELEVIYNGQQVRTVREHTLTFPSFALTGGAGATAAAPAGNGAAPAAGTDTADNIKKAGEAIRGLFGNKGKK